MNYREMIRSSQMNIILQKRKNKSFKSDNQSVVSLHLKFWFSFIGFYHNVMCLMLKIDNVSV